MLVIVVDEVVAVADTGVVVVDIHGHDSVLLVDDELVERLDNEEDVAEVERVEDGDDAVVGPDTELDAHWPVGWDGIALDPWDF